MKAFRSAAAILLLLAAVAVAVGPASASVEGVCQKATKGSEYYGYCVSSLESAAGSAGKDDALSLSVAATALAQQRFSDNLGRIQEVLKAGGLDKASERALRACDNVYSRGLLKLLMAGDRLQNRDFYGASNYLSTARDDAVSCGDVFTKFGIRSLLQPENDESLKRCYVAIHVAQQLN